MEHHDLAGVIPAMPEESFATFKADIAVRGQLFPIIIYEGKVLDGRNRLRACEELGLTPKMEAFVGTREEALARVISLNVERRHLTTAQRAEIAAGLVTSTHGGDRSKTSNDVLPLKKAAKLMGVSTASVDRARARKKPKTPILDKARDIVRPLVEAGKPIQSRKLQGEHGISHRSIEAAVAVERAVAEAQADPIFGREDLSATAQQKFDSALKRAVETARIEIRAEVMEGARKIWDELYLPDYKRKLTDAERILAGRRGVFFRSDFRKILACLHSDANMSKAKLDEAFNLMQSQEVVLVKPDPVPVSPAVAARMAAMPKTFADLMAAKERIKAERAAKRAAAKTGVST